MIRCELGLEIAWQTYLRTKSNVLRDELIKNYIVFVKQVALKKCNQLEENQKSLVRTSFQADDLLNFAYETMIKCFDRFDPTFGYGSIDRRFTAFSRTRIANSPVDAARKYTEIPYRYGGEKRKMYTIKDEHRGYYTQEHDFIEKEVLEGFFSDVFHENIFDLTPLQYSVLHLYTTQNMNCREISNHINIDYMKVVNTQNSTIAKIKHRIKKSEELKEFYRDNI